MTDEAAEYLLTLAKAQGVACATVKDGHVLVFQRDHLKRIAEGGDSETLVIFVKRPAMQ